MKEDFSNYSFSIIKHRGTPNSAVTTEGFEVVRSEEIWIPQWLSFARCAPYDDHFVYADPSDTVGRWWLMCTCGSPAVITGYNAYKQDASKDEMPMIVCYIHAMTGVHATGGSRWYTGGV